MWTNLVLFLERSTVVYGGCIEVGAAGIAVRTECIALCGITCSVSGET